MSIEEARANFVPALSNAAQATLTLNATMQALDTSFREAISEIQNAGLVDRQSVDLAIQTAIAEAAAQQTALETQAGTTFGEASAAFTPGLSDISQAGVDRDTTLGDISQSETEEIDELNAQSIADRLETDAAITETRDVFLKASAQETLKYQTEVRQINNAMRVDIREIDKTLRVNLESIDDTLDAELAEIRELKSVFDTKISAMITAINEQGNLDVANLKADTAAMRSSLETIAEEARDNQWKGALLKIANVGITVAGVAIGTAVGAPQVGFVVGQAVGIWLSRAVMNFSISSKRIAWPGQSQENRHIGVPENRKTFSQPPHNCAMLQMSHVRFPRVSLKGWRAQNGAETVGTRRGKRVSQRRSMLRLCWNGRTELRLS